MTPDAFALEALRRGLILVDTENGIAYAAADAADAADAAADAAYAARLGRKKHWSACADKLAELMAAAPVVEAAA